MFHHLAHHSSSHVIVIRSHFHSLKNFLRVQAVQKNALILDGRRCTSHTLTKKEEKHRLAIKKNKVTKISFHFEKINIYFEHKCYKTFENNGKWKKELFIGY